MNSWRQQTEAGENAFGGLLLKAELASGGVDVMAFLQADGGGDADSVEDVTKGRLPCGPHGAAA
ncbi:MAG: hypothetical protein KA004_08440 [Verrucomicrobiales bacterium]|nr:hypothetical protein [Verrucomicrobiales bacterium]